MRVLNDSGASIGYLDPFGMVDQLRDRMLLASDETVDSMTVVLPKGNWVVSELNESFNGEFYSPSEKIKKMKYFMFGALVAFATSGLTIVLATKYYL